MAGLRSRLRRAVGRPDARALLAALLTLAVVLPVWWLASNWYEDRLLAQEREDVALEASLRGNTLSSVINRKLARLQGLCAFVQVEMGKDDFAQEFQQFAAGLYEGAVGIRYLAVAPGGIVRYVYPLAGNESALGYEAASDPRSEVRLDVQRAIESEEVALTGPLEVVPGGLRLMAWQAVYQGGAYWGLVSMELDMESMLQEAGLAKDPGTLDFALRKGLQVFYGSKQVLDSSPALSVIHLPDDEWELAAAPTAGWEATVQGPLRVFQRGGLIIIGLLAGLAFLSVNREARLAQAVRDRTREIVAVNERLQEAYQLLEHRVEERTRELSMLLEVSAHISSTLDLPLLLEQILEQLHQVVDYDGASVVILEGDELRHAAHRGPIPPKVLSQLRLSREQAGDLWKALEGHRPLIIGDVREDTGLARAFRQALGEYLDREMGYVRTWLGIPLIVQERLIGWLSLHHSKLSAYVEHDATLAQAIGSQAATAIENARLYGQARRLAALEERQRLARELHDSVSQVLYAVGLGARTARALVDRADLAPELRSGLVEALDYVLSLAEVGLAEMRALIFELRPDSLEREGLVVALTRQADAVRVRQKIDVRTGFCSEPALPLEAKEALYRIAQEALSNVAKHAQASRLELRLGPDEGGLALEVQDNGVGFDPQRECPGHMGLCSMRERAAKLGGKLEISSSPGHGTLLRAWIPLGEAPEVHNAG
jgi:signal transduction histidine kinase/sensor domain CHASE-containing protein